MLLPPPEDSPPLEDWLLLSSLEACWSSLAPLGDVGGDWSCDEDGSGEVPPVAGEEAGAAAALGASSPGVSLVLDAEAGAEGGADAGAEGGAEAGDEGGAEVGDEGGAEGSEVLVPAGEVSVTGCSILPVLSSCPA